MFFPSSYQLFPTATNVLSFLLSTVSYSIKCSFLSPINCFLQRQMFFPFFYQLFPTATNVLSFLLSTVSYSDKCSFLSLINCFLQRQMFFPFSYQLFPTATNVLSFLLSTVSYSNKCSFLSLINCFLLRQMFFPFSYQLFPTATFFPFSYQLFPTATNVLSFLLWTISNRGKCSFLSTINCFLQRNVLFCRFPTTLIARVTWIIPSSQYTRTSSDMLSALSSIYNPF